MNEATRLAQRILEEQGYIVMAFRGRRAPYIGEVWSDPAVAHGGIGDNAAGSVSGPFFILANATQQEFIMQAERYAPDSGEGARRHEAIAFFRVTAE